MLYISFSCHKNFYWTVCLQSLCNMLTRCKTDFLKCDFLNKAELKKSISGQLMTWLCSNKTAYKIDYRLNLTPRFLVNLLPSTDYLLFSFVFSGRYVRKIILQTRNLKLRNTKWFSYNQFAAELFPKSIVMPNLLSLCHSW